MKQTSRSSPAALRFNQTSRTLEHTVSSFLKRVLAHTCRSRRCATSYSAGAAFLWNTELGLHCSVGFRPWQTTCADIVIRLATKRTSLREIFGHSCDTVPKLSLEKTRQEAHYTSHAHDFNGWLCDRLFCIMNMGTEYFQMERKMKGKKERCFPDGEKDEREEGKMFEDQPSKIYMRPHNECQNLSQFTWPKFSPFGNGEAGCFFFWSTCKGWHCRVVTGIHEQMNFSNSEILLAKISEAHETA